MGRAVTGAQMPAFKAIHLEIAKQHYEHALQLIDQKDWNAAIHQFREVIRLAPLLNSACP
jgi:TolA-binding protein